MLSASILKIFYWPGARYDTALLTQALIMVVVQVVLLKVALDNRPGRRRRRDASRGPFDDLEPEVDMDVGNGGGGGFCRPWRFWRWRRQRPYWECLGGLTLALLAAHTVLKPTPGRGGGGWADAYTLTIGYVGLAIEAVLPIPQLLANQRARSCKGFRVSVLVNWLLGDAMKMGFFFLAEEGKVPWAFKLCGLFQAACDLGLGAQWWVFGEGERRSVSRRGREMAKGKGMNGKPV